MTVVEASLATAVLAGAPLLYAALGELLGEKVGLLNIGLDGIMLMGAVTGFIVAVETGSALLGLFAGGAAGALFTVVVYTVPVVLLKSDQGIVGFAEWFVGTGLSAMIGASFTSRSLDGGGFTETNIPLLESIPYLGNIFFKQPWPVYLGVALTLVAAFVLMRTRHGLDMRAVGEDPASAHAMGVRVRSWQVFYSGVCGFLTGMGGAVLTLAVTLNWKDDVTAGRGWIALALVIFAAWKPLSLLWAAFAFGTFLMLAPFGQTQDWEISSSFLAMVPYIFTIAILAVRTWRAVRRKAFAAEPAALGMTFVRGQR
jgi:general nucleoside transport system permease protein